MSVINDLTPDQVKIVYEMGFGGLLELSCDTLPRALAQWLAMNCEPKTRTVTLPSGYEFSVNSYYFHMILGVPLGGKKVMQKCDKANLEFIRNETGCKGSHPTINELMGLITKDLVGDKFKRVFLLFALTCFLCPTSNEAANPEFYNAVVDIDNVREYDWCGLAVESLMFFIEKFKRDGSVVLGGCLLAFVILYLELLDTDLIGTCDHLPLLVIWTSDLVKSYEKADATSADGLHYGHLPLKDISKTPFRTRNITAQHTVRIQERFEYTFKSFIPAEDRLELKEILEDIVQNMFEEVMNTMQPILNFHFASLGQAVEVLDEFKQTVTRQRKPVKSRKIKPPSKIVGQHAYESSKSNQDELKKKKADVDLSLYSVGGQNVLTTQELDEQIQLPNGWDLSSLGSLPEPEGLDTLPSKLDLLQLEPQMKEVPAPDFGFTKFDMNSYMFQPDTQKEEKVTLITDQVKQHVFFQTFEEKMEDPIPAPVVMPIPEEKCYKMQTPSGSNDQSISCKRPQRGRSMNERLLDLIESKRRAKFGKSEDAGSKDVPSFAAESFIMLPSSSESISCRTSDQSVTSFNRGIYSSQPVTGSACGNQDKSANQCHQSKYVPGSESSVIGPAVHKDSTAPHVKTVSTPCPPTQCPVSQQYADESFIRIPSPIDPSVPSFSLGLGFSQSPSASNKCKSAEHPSSGVSSAVPKESNAPQLNPYAVPCPSIPRTDTQCHVPQYFAAEIKELKLKQAMADGEQVIPARHSASHAKPFHSQHSDFYSGHSAANAQTRPIHLHATNSVTQGSRQPEALSGFPMHANTSVPQAHTSNEFRPATQRTENTCATQECVQTQKSSRRPEAQSNTSVPQPNRELRPATQWTESSYAPQASWQAQTGSRQPVDRFGGNMSAPQPSLQPQMNQAQDIDVEMFEGLDDIEIEYYNKKIYGECHADDEGYVHFKSSLVEQEVFIDMIARIPRYSQNERSIRVISLEEGRFWTYHRTFATNMKVYGKVNKYIVDILAKLVMKDQLWNFNKGDLPAGYWKRHVILTKYGKKLQETNLYPETASESLRHNKCGGYHLCTMDLIFIPLQCANFWYLVVANFRSNEFEVLLPNNHINLVKEDAEQVINNFKAAFHIIYRNYGSVKIWTLGTTFRSVSTSNKDSDSAIFIMKLIQIYAGTHFMFHPQNAKALRENLMYYMLTNRHNQKIGMLKEVHDIMANHNLRIYE